MSFTKGDTKVVTDVEQAKRHIASRLKEARHKANLSQKQLADESGVSPAAIMRYETEKNLAPIDRLAKLANTLEVGLTFFLQDLSPEASAGYENHWLPVVEQENSAELAVRMRDLVDKLSAEGGDVNVFVSVAPDQGRKSDRESSGSRSGAPAIG